MKKQTFSVIGVVALIFFLAACKSPSEKKSTKISQKPVAIKEIDIPDLPAGFNSKNAFAEAPKKGAIAEFWHAPSFDDQVNVELKILPEMASRKISMYQIADGTSISDSISAGKIKPMSIQEFAQALASMISRQRAGGPGDLLINGNGNIFFVEISQNRNVFVSVWWGSPFAKNNKKKMWSMAAVDPVEDNWHGNQIFFRN